jgi:two-component system NtrC family response regulator
MILIVDDDPSITASLSLALKQAGLSAHAASSPDEALAALGRLDVDLVLQDMNFSRNTSGEEGLALLSRIQTANPRLPVVLMTAWGSIGLAVAGMKAGAADFVTKPWSNPQLLQVVRTALGLAESVNAPEASTREELDLRYDFHTIVGEDPRLLHVLRVAGRVAGTDASVLVTGESGTGKELVAEAIHRNSRRRTGPFVKVNLGGVASTLFESEMFGHVKGAFTDARQDRRGRFDLADGGTIFLDEIGELDPGSQVKMLRVLQDRAFEVLGSSVPRTVDVRVVSATNRSLDQMVRAGTFREDLLYRINLITLHLPPLRDRVEDVPAIASRTLLDLAAAYGRESLSLTRSAVRWLQAQAWPGNVRQLRQVLERAVLIGTHSVLDVADLAASDAAVEHRDQALPAVGSMTIDEIERAMILKSMRFHHGNLTRVAEALGLSRAALYRRLEKYGIGE